MSNVDVCAFAHEGKFREVYERIEAQPDLVTKKDQVSRKKVICFKLNKLMTAHLIIFKIRLVVFQ